MAKKKINDDAAGVAYSEVLTETAPDDAPSRARRSKLDVMRSLLSRMSVAEFAAAKPLWEDERQSRKAAFDDL